MLREKLKYAIHFCKSIDTDDYARVAMAGGGGAQGAQGDNGASDTDTDDWDSIASDEHAAHGGSLYSPH